MTTLVAYDAEQPLDPVKYMQRLAEYLGSNPAGTIPGLSPPESQLSSESTSNGSPHSSEGHAESVSPTEIVPQKLPSPKAKKATGEKRKSNGTNGKVKDRRSSSSTGSAAGGIHSHEVVDPTRTSDDKSVEEDKTVKGKTSEKRKEQNRLAQRAFRERKEKHTKELEERLLALEQQSVETDSENNSLKQLLERLQEDNARLLNQTSFSFIPPADGVMPVSSTFASGVPLLPPPPPHQPPLFDLPPLLPPAPAFVNDFMTAVPLFSPPIASTSSGNSYFPVTSPSANLDFEVFSSLNDSTFLSTSLSSPLPSSHLADPLLGSTGSSYAFSPLSYRDDAPPTLDETSFDAPSASMLSVPAYALPTLVKPCPYEFDEDGLCADMAAKATCEDMARQALKAAMEEDALRLH